MTTALVPQDAAGVIERVITAGDLSRLSPQDRIMYYRQTCESLGLNPLTRPFEYITLNGKLTLYARRDATDQLRKLHGVSVQIVGREVVGDVFMVTARATDRGGRSDESVGVVSIKGLQGENLANAFMKAESKAKRRVTLSIVGLGMLDEGEVVTVPDARFVRVDTETGEIDPPARIQAPRPTPPPADDMDAASDAMPSRGDELKQQQAAKANGNGRKPNIKTAAWAAMGAELAKGGQYANDNGTFNGFHALNALVAEGWTQDINDETVNDAMELLRKHAASKA